MSSEADRKTGEIQDVLYVTGVRADEYTHVTAHPSEAGDLVRICVYPNNWRCAGCRSKGLVKKVLGAFSRDSDEDCSGCRKQAETNAFHARARVSQIVATLSADYTVVDQDAYSGTGHVYIQV